MMRRLWYVSFGCAICALVIGYVIGGLWIWTLPILGLTALRLSGQPKWVSSLELPLFIGLGAIGIWQDLPFGWMLLGMIAALTAWDIASFHQRMEDVVRVEQRPALERKYLQRLLIITGSGALLAVAAVSLTVTFSFGSALLLGFLAVLGLSRTIGFLQRESD